MAFKIIFDTDLGGDIDDALALALCLNIPEVEILGITTVYLGALWRAGITRDMLKLYGREIPVILGAEKPLIGEWNPAHQPNGESETPSISSRNYMTAADYIVKTVMEEDETIILAIGPLTNVALALHKAPEIANRTRVVLMGGMYTSARPEWNIECDPEAARTVFESGIPIDMIGLDVTEKCVLSHEEVKRVTDTGNPRTDLLKTMFDKFFSFFDFMPTLHDPLAAASIFWPELIKFEDKYIAIETKGEFTRGCTVDRTHFESRRNCRVAIDVNADKFKKRILEKISL